MKRKLIANSLVIVAVTGLLPVNAAMAATTVSASTSSVRVVSSDPISLVGSGYVYDNTVYKEQSGRRSVIYKGSELPMTNSWRQNYEVYITTGEERPRFRVMYKIESDTDVNTYSNIYERTEKKYYDSGLTTQQKSDIKAVLATSGHDTCYIYYDFETSNKHMRLSYSSSEDYGLSIYFTRYEDSESQLNEIKSNIKSCLIDFVANNNNTKEDLLNYINNNVDLKGKTVTIDNFNIQQSTEFNGGKITGILKLNNNDEFNFALPIAQLPQSIDTVYNNYNKVISKLNVNNKTKAEDIINTVNITNNNIKVSIENFKVKEATDIMEGSITGTLNIIYGSIIKTIPINLSIDKLAQSSNTASNNITSVLGNIKCNNDTTEEEILNAVKVGIDTSCVSVQFSTEKGEEFKIINATESTEGKITGMIVVNDGKGNVKVPVNIKIDRLPQSLDTVFDQYTKVIQNFKGNNNTAEKDILDSVSITNKDITNSIEDFEKIEATDIKEGSITGKIILKNGLSILEIPINITIDKLAQSSDTASKIINSMLQNFKGTNDTTEEEILNAVKVGVDISSVNVEFSTEEGKTFNIIPSTERSVGKITGTLIINDGKASQEVPINIKIDKQAQSLDTLYEQSNVAINGYRASNNTTENDILELIHITNDSLDKVIEGFKVTEATETSKGHLNGKVILTDGLTYKEIDLSNIEIDYLEQSLSTAKLKVEKVLSKYTLENTTTEEDVKSLIKSVIDNNLYEVEAQINIVKKATTDNTGIAEIYVQIKEKDNTNNYIEIKNSYKVATDPVYQNAQQLENKLNNYFLTYEANNDTEENDILEAINNSGIKTNPSLIIEFGTPDDDGNFQKIKATDKSEGKITGKIYINKNEGLVNLTGDNELIIKPKSEYQTIDTLKNKITEELKKLELPCTVEEINVKEYLENLKTNEKLIVEFINYKKEPSTATIKGNITGEILISNSIGENIKINNISIPLELDLSNQSISEAKKGIEKVLIDYIPTNETTKQDVINDIKKIVTNPNISINIEDEKFNKLFATAKKDGSIQTIINLSNGLDSINIDTGKLIIKKDSKYQTIDELIFNIEDILTKYKPVNETTNQDLNNYINAAITNNKFIIEISSDNYKKELATSRKDGSIIADIVIKDSNNNSEIVKNSGKLIIDKQVAYQTKEDVQLDILDKLKEFNANNDTNKDELLKYLDESISEKFEISIKDEDFKKIEATAQKDGSIETIVNIVDKTDNSQTTQSTGQIVISKQPSYQTDKELEESINNILKDFIPDNRTTEKDILDLIHSVITNGNSAEFGQEEGEEFTKKESTTKAKGSITGTIDIGNLKININLEIPKKNSSSSGSSSSNKNNITSNSSKSFNLLGIERNDITSNINTLIGEETTDTTEELLKGVESELYVVSIPYLEDNNLLDNDNKGSVKLLYGADECVGVVLESESEYTNDTVISIKTEGIKIDEIKTYSYNPDLDLYVESNPEIKMEDNILKMRGTGKSKYILSVNELNDNTVAKQGWNYKGDSWYYLENEDCKGNWIFNDGHWYNCDNNTKQMKTGWLKDSNEQWYYLNTVSDGTKGAMKTGWQKINEDWYFFNSDGSMVSNSTVDGYYLDQNGTWVK